MRFLKGFAMFLGVALSTFVQSARADISYSSAGGVYTQNFDTLATTGTGIDWTNGASGTIAGWYADRSGTLTYNAGNGSANAGAIYSFGTVGQTDRALGSVGSGATGTIRYGVRFTNNSGATLTSFTVSFDGEQWRNGGSGQAQEVTFSYNIGTGLSLNSTGFTDVDSLNFSSVVNAGGAAALDGNSPLNRVSRNATVAGVNWANGQDLFLRWSDIDHPGADHGLAIDNLSFSAVPEPASILLLGVAGVGGLAFRRFRRKAVKGEAVAS